MRRYRGFFHWSGSQSIFCIAQGRWDGRKEQWAMGGKKEGNIEGNMSGKMKEKMEGKIKKRRKEGRKGGRKGKDK